jgi:hypothetical protein
MEFLSVQQMLSVRHYGQFSRDKHTRLSGTSGAAFRTE